MITVDEFKNLCERMDESLKIIVPLEENEKYTKEEVSQAKSGLCSTIFELLVAKTFDADLSDEEYERFDLICDIAQQTIDKILYLDYVNSKIADPNYVGQVNKDQLRDIVKKGEFQLELNYKLMRGFVLGVLSFLQRRGIKRY